MGAIYEWDYIGREYSWTVTLSEVGVTLVTTPKLEAGANMIGRWGFSTNTIDDRLRASELKIEVIDPDLALYNALTDTDNEEGDFTLQMVDSTGTYTLNMRVRLDEVSTLLVEGLEQQITTLYAYCGISDMSNADAVVLASSTLSNLFNLILISNGLSQDIEYYIAHYPENAGTSDPLLDMQRLNRLDLIFAESGRKVDTMHDQLNSLADGFGVMVANGLDGKWHVKHEYALGDTLTDRGAQFYDVSGGTLSTLNTLTLTAFTLTNSNISRNTIKTPIRPVQAVQIERGNERDFITADLVRHGDFEYGWLSGTTHQVWDVQGTGISRAIGDTGNYSVKLVTNSSIEQYLPRFGGGQDMDFEIAMRYALREEAGTGASRQFTFFLTHFNRPFGFASGLNTLSAGDIDGWKTFGAGGYSFTTTSADASAGLTWNTLVTWARGPMPDEDGYLFFQVVGNTDANLYLDTVEVRPVKSGDATTKFIGVSGRYDGSNNLITKGNVVEQVVPWYNGLMGTDPGDDGTRDEVIPMMQVITTTLGSWIQASDFKSFVAGYTAGEYFDLFELASQIRIAQQDTTIEQIEGEVCAIVPHDKALLYDTKTYLQTYTEIDFKTEITRFVAIHKRFGAAQQLLLEHTYWSAFETSASPANLNAIYKSLIPVDTDTVPWETDSDPSDKEIINVGGVDSTDVALHVRIDPLANNNAGYLFYTGDTTDTAYRTNLDGSSATDSGLTAWGLAVQPSQSRICIYNLTTFTEYDHDFTAIRTLRTRTASVEGAPAYDQSYTYMFFGMVNDAGPTDRISRITLSDLSKTDLIDMSALTLTSLDSAEMLVDEAAGWVFFLSTASPRKIYRFTYPGGSTLNEVVSSAGRGLALDRLNQKIIYSDTLGDIWRSDYDGTNAEQIYDYTSNLEVYAIDIGHS